MRRPDEVPISMIVECERSRGRPETKRRECIKKDLERSTDLVKKKYISKKRTEDEGKRENMRILV